MWVTLKDGTTIECENKCFTDGGEGELFFDKSGNHVIKLYKEEKITSHRENTLDKIISPEYNVLIGSEETYWDELFAWPKAIVTQPRLGIIMRCVSENYRELLWFLGSKTRKKIPKNELGTWADYIQITMKMAQIVRRMHLRGLCHSDLSFRNFLVYPPQQKVTLIDCDGLVVPNFLLPNVIGTPKCMAPELVINSIQPTIETDLHALGTIIYWLLFQRHPLLGSKKHHKTNSELDEKLALGQKALFIEHPTNKSNRPHGGVPDSFTYTVALTPAMQKLVRKVFIDGLHNPKKRPSAAEWEQALARMSDSLVPCSNDDCPLGYFVLQPNQPTIQCPCQTPFTQFKTVPVLRFYKPSGRRQNYTPDKGYIMIGQPGRILHSWHVNPFQGQGPEVDQQPKAKIIYQNNDWFLENIQLPELRLVASNGQSNSQRIKPGESLRLTNQANILLGEKNKSRLIYVQMKKL